MAATATTAIHCHSRFGTGSLRTAQAPMVPWRRTMIATIAKSTVTMSRKPTKIETGTKRAKSKIAQDDCWFWSHRSNAATSRKNPRNARVETVGAK